MVGGMLATHHNLVGLARVSTDSQDAQLQRDALAAAGCGRVFEEKVSTRSAARPGLAAAVDYLRPDHGDVLTVWKLDRLGRSVKDVLTIADDLHERTCRAGHGPRPRPHRGPAHCHGHRQARGRPRAARQRREPHPDRQALNVSRASIYRHLAAAEQP